MSNLGGAGTGVALSVSLNGEKPEQRPLGVPRNPSELGFSDSSRIRPDLWSLETSNSFFPGVEGPFLPQKKSGLSFSKASFGSSGLQDTGNTDEQSFKILTTQRDQTQQSPSVQLTLNRHASQALKKHLELDVKTQVSGPSEKGAFIPSRVRSFNQCLFWQVSTGLLKAAQSPPSCQLQVP